MDMMSVWLYVLVLSLQFVGGWNSPCPGIFDYEIDGEAVNGIISVKPRDDQRPVSSLEIKLSMTVVWNIDKTTIVNMKEWLSQHSDSERLNIEDIDGIEPFSSENLRMYNEGQAVKYRIQLTYITLMQPLPKVTAISVNGNTICFGPGEKPGRIDKLVALVSLHHKSILNSATLGSTFETQEQEPNVAFFSIYTRNLIIPLMVLYWDSNSVMTNKLQPSNGAQGQRALEKPIKLNQEPITTDECGVVAGGNERVPLINNGIFYERGDIPWLVAIYRNVEDTLRFICGGTLVSDRHVVTAAHCMKRRYAVTPMKDIVVKAGVHSLNSWSDDFIVTRQLMAATIHKEYDPLTIQNDIMILTLDKPVKFNRYIRPACLWSGDTDLIRVVGVPGVVAGWGRGEESIGAKQYEPRMVHVPIVSTKECRASKSAFHQLTFNTTLCAGNRNGAGPCEGDSGGGLYLFNEGKWRLRGVVSVSVKIGKGALTCNLNEYVVYTDAAQFLPWIRNILSEKYYD